MNFTIDSLIEAIAQEKIPLLGLSAIEYYYSSETSRKKVHAMQGRILHDLFDCLGFYANIQTVIENLSDVPSINTIKNEHTRLSRVTNFCKFLVRTSVQKIQRNTTQDIGKLLSDHQMNLDKALEMLLQYITKTTENTTQPSVLSPAQNSQPDSIPMLASATN